MGKGQGKHCLEMFTMGCKCVHLPFFHYDCMTLSHCTHLSNMADSEAVHSGCYILYANCVVFDECQNLRLQEIIKLLI